MLPWVVEVKTAEEIVKMRAAGKVAREVLDSAGAAIKAGISTDEIDALVHAETLKVRVLIGQTVVIVCKDLSRYASERTNATRRFDESV